MKKRRIERVERRRQLAEPNLLGEAKVRSAKAPRGVVAKIRRALKRER